MASVIEQNKFDNNNLHEQKNNIQIPKKYNYINTSIDLHTANPFDLNQFKDIFNNNV